MEWISKPKKMKDPRWLTQFEKKENYRFPEAYRQMVLACDEGVPKLGYFDTETRRNCEVVVFLSFDPEADCSIWVEGDYGEEEERMKRYVGFSYEGCGDDICFDKQNDSVVYVDHETLEVEQIASSFEEFLNMLHDYTE